MVVMEANNKRSRRSTRSRVAGVLAALFLSSPVFTTQTAAQSTLPPAQPDGVAQAVVRRAGLEGRVLWLDGTANLERLSTRQGVAAVLDRCLRARINTIVVD